MQNPHWIQEYKETSEELPDELFQLACNCMAIIILNITNLNTIDGKKAKGHQAVRDIINSSSSTEKQHVFA